MLRKHKRLTKKELKKDPFLIFTAQAIDYLREEWVKIAGTAAAVVAIIAVAFLVVNGRTKSKINAFDTALTALSNNAPEALELLDHAANKYSGSDKAGEALITLGNRYLMEKDFDSAEKYFSQYIKKYTSNPILSLNASTGLASVYEEKGDFKKAAETYESYIKKNSADVFAPMMHINAGKAYYHAGDKDNARRHFTAVADNETDNQQKQEAEFFLEMLN